MYSVKCEMCSGEYVGETLRALRVRKKEHCDAIRLGQSPKSSIAEHVHDQSMPHEINWLDMMCTLEEAAKVRETFQIQQRKSRLNRDGGI